MGAALTRYIPGGRIVPDRLITTVRYQEQIVPTAASGFDQLMNINSIFDPNRSGTGHQPLGHDQLATLYGRYRVVKCAWEIDVTNIGLATYGVCCVVPTNSASSFASSVETAAEQPYAQTKSISGMATISGSWPASVRFKGSISLDRLYGTTRSNMDGPDRYQAVFGASPTELAILHICGTEITGQTAFAALLNVGLTYTVEVYDRIQLSAS